MTTLAELTTPLTRADVETAIYAAIAARGGKVTSWKPGGVARSIIYGLAIVVSGLSNLSALIAKSGFLELSEGDWLTLVALYVYGVERDGGTFATGIVVVDNAGGGVYAGGPDELVFTSATNGKNYRNTEAYSIGAMATGVAIAVQAVELGADSTASPGEIDAFATPLLGLTCTNPGALVGRDREEDPALRSRCYAKTGALSPNGPRDAYSYVVRTAVRPSDNSSIGVTRVRTLADGAGGVAVYVADADGPVSGPDLAILQGLVEQLCEPQAVDATVINATAVSVPVTYELWVRDSGRSEASIQAAVEERLTEFFAAQPIGGVKLEETDPAGKVFVSALQTVIGAVVSGPERREVRVEVTLPAGDVTLDVDEAPVLGAITVTAIHQVAAGVL
jgi:uncharacterized phage protein gp47/JayE